MKKLELIPDWRKGWRFWSVQLQMAGAAILAFLEVFPDVFLSLWLATPPDIRDAFDPETLRFVGIGFVLLGTVARFIKQRKLGEPRHAPSDYDAAQRGRG